MEESRKYNLDKPQHDSCVNIGTDHFATELLKEVKAGAKRWFIAFLVVLGLWFATIGAFVWYISLPVEVETVEQQSDNNSNNYVVGGDYNGGETDGNKNEESDKNTEQ